MPLPQKETRGGWWWLRLLMLVAFLVACLIAFGSDLINGNSNEPHRPPHSTSTHK
ncbi:MAG TPA: hypothetical protein VJ843_03525 [Candidatus Saccharimonadales bacterium]|nr:hypothetical protein [Candidatus Saccharimonadales bacterium]